MVDTLIVGGGTAGCVLAARLSEDPDHRVRLLEAGPAAAPPDLRDATRLPGASESPWLWRYPVRLTTATAGSIVRGRVIGGSGVVNGGYFARATAADFAAWSRVFGAGPAWSFDAVLPSFQRSERDLDFGDQPGHGAAGPIPVRRCVPARSSPGGGAASPRRDPAAEHGPAPVSAEFVRAATALGFPEIEDLNAVAAPVTGIGRVPCNVENGSRVDTGSAYLRPALTRPNLTVTAGILVVRIRFDGSRAIGVDGIRDGRNITLWADRIVLCAGAVESAALLLRSGIGDPGRLRALDITVRQAAPVGHRFDDHPEIGIEYRRTAPNSGADTVPLEYVLELDDLEIRPYTVRFTPGTHRLGVAAMRPHSSGVLRLRSADPLVPPELGYRYLSAAHDRRRLREGVEVADALLAELPISRVTERAPAAGPALDAWLRANLTTSQHLSGTCRMGPAGDPAAVVDERCRVHGVAGLSVADLSVIPVPLSRGPQATVVMLAERVSGFLAR